MTGRTTYDPTPCSDGDYEAYRLGRHITYLRCSYHLGRDTENTISAYRRGALKLPPASIAELERDRAALRQDSADHWAAMKRAVCGLRELRSRIRVEKFVAGGQPTVTSAALETQIDATKRDVLRHAHGSRDARRMIAYLDVRLAALNQPAMAAE